MTFNRKVILRCQQAADQDWRRDDRRCRRVRAAKGNAKACAQAGINKVAERLK